MIPDIINGGFESVGALCIWGNFRRIRRDKMVRGVDWRVTGFFTLWGLWNLYYYPSLHQWCSFAGGLALVAGSAGWVYYAIKYRRN